MQIITSTRIGPASDVTALATDLSTNGQTLMIAYTTPQARTGHIQLYQIEPG